jgi:pimeloyl-ACP methyl ester carboxylesterase
MATFVLLHGSWHAGWCWHKIVSRLAAAGHTAVAPDLPAHGRSWKSVRGAVTLGAMARSVCELIDGIDEPVVLVAHSRAGIVASTVAELRPKRVRKVVYLASYMLRSGERVLEHFRSDSESLVLPNISINRLTMTDMLQESAYREALYADCSDDDVALARALLTPEPMLPALTRVSLSEEAYGRVPRYYIELTQDRAVTPALQQRLYEALPCERVFRLDASHSAYFSRPDELTEILTTIARA